MFPRSISTLCIAGSVVLGLAANLSAAPISPHSGATSAPEVRDATNPAQIRPLHLVVGFMGGRVKASNHLHMEATVAQDLRDREPSDVKVLVFANHDGEHALRTVLHLIDQDGDHTISEPERNAVGIAIYGHSWGASETVNLARSLQASGIPVALTVQVDSVPKYGQDDQEIPSNVREAVNLFQRDGLLRGRGSIHAQDPTKTRIVLNKQYHYGAHHLINIARFPWFARTFMRQHIMIENDPEVWASVEDFLLKSMEEDGITAQ